MTKKIAILAILITLFIAGNLLASEKVWFGGNVIIHTSNPADVVIGYKDINNNEYPQEDWDDYSSGTYPFGFPVNTGAPAPVKIYAEGTAPYGCYDYDECVANPNGTHTLELWLGVEPPGEEDPEQ
jgi:hypothetical protein